jgi:hypothetical protein
MNSNLVYSIHLNEDHKYKSLYDWCLEEHDSDGVVGNEYPPFQWRVSFIAKIVSNLNELSCNSDANILLRSSKDGIPEVDLVGSTSPSIIAELHPGFIEHESKKIKNSKRFQILGTKDEIENFVLEIYPISELKKRRSDGSDKKVGFMTCWPKMELGEVYNKKIYQPSLNFMLFIESDTFNNLSQIIAGGNLSNLQFSATNVDGLYAPWEPDAEFSRDIKVLPGDQTDYKVMHNGEEIPFTKRAGSLSNYNLSYAISRKMDAMQIIETDNIS